jgi:hypothetical protein
MELVTAVYTYPQFTPAQHKEIAEKVCWGIWEPFID